jgi:tetratricopeptide (TPR) repeat protein
MSNEISQASRLNDGKVSRHLIISIHGIRTFGQWQNRLATLVKAREKNASVVKYKFRYFSAPAFMFPPLRWLEMHRFRRDLLSRVESGNWDRIDIVAHSFGTYIAGWGLHGIPPEKRPSLHTIIFAGSVLKPGFPWRDLIGKSVGRLVNDCANTDRILILNQVTVLGTSIGMAGRVGFVGMNDDRFMNRHFDFGHSGYFAKGKTYNDDDEFMRRYWVPLLTSADSEPEEVDEREATFWQGIMTFLLNNTEPFKLLLYLVIISLPLIYVNSLRVQAVNAFQAQIQATERAEKSQQDAEIALSKELEARKFAEEQRVIAENRRIAEEQQRQRAIKEKNRAEQQTRIAVNRLNDIKEQGTLYQDALSFSLRKDSDLALKKFRELLKFYENKRYSFGKIATLLSLGYNSERSEKEEKRTAVSYYEEAIRLLANENSHASSKVKERNRGTIINTNRLIGGIYSQSKNDEDKEKAAKYYETALNLFDENDDHSDRAELLQDIGDQYRELRDPIKKIKAVDYYEKMVSAIDEGKDEAAEIDNDNIEADVTANTEAVLDQDGSAYIRIAEVYGELGQEKKASEYYDRASQAFDELSGSPSFTYNKSDLYIRIGTSYESWGESRNAEKYYERAMSLYREDPKGEANVLRRIGKTYQSVNKNDQALGYYGRALSRFRELGDTSGEGETLKLIKRIDCSSSK